MSVLFLLLFLQDTYHTIPLVQLATTRWTHVCTVGIVSYVRLQKDGDIHVTLVEGPTKVVAEIIPAIPLPRPKKGQKVEVCGISRIDRWHKWPEIHPVLRWQVVP